MDNFQQWMEPFLDWRNDRQALEQEVKAQEKAMEYQRDIEAGLRSDV